jgi:hypothetical protein
MVLLAALAGCDTTLTLTPEELEIERSIGMMLLTTDTWDYRGSKNGYDYLYNNRVAFQNARYFRIAEKHNIVTRRFAYTDDESRWVRLPWGIDPARASRVNAGEVP